MKIKLNKRFKKGPRFIVNKHAIFYGKRKATRPYYIEDSISANPKLSGRYAVFILRRRWPEAEKYIALHPVSSYLYAHYIIKGRWEPGEKAISQHGYYSYLYADLIHSRFELGEPNILKISKYRCACYARYSIGDRWPELEALLVPGTGAYKTYESLMRKIGK